ncbi:MAG: glycosyltransferase family 4 protein [Bacteroidetes bacterium]|nr:glycosyltransferase family 4 protein [Bacteroidota bacterium]
MKEVKLIFRKPFPDSFSIEYIFNTLHNELKVVNFPVTKIVLPRHSKGILNRLKNLFFVLRYSNKIVHITGDVHYVLLGAWRSKRILTIHDLNFMERHSGLRKSIYKWFWISLPIFFAHKVTVISEATKNEVLKYINRGHHKIEVIYDFIDPIYKPYQRSFNLEKPLILQVGTSFNKNLLSTIESLRGINCRFAIIGHIDEPTLSHLEECQIEFENYRNLTLEELHAKYLEADILIYISLKEGFGMPILEAQSTGLPVITSNCSSMPEIGGEGAALYVNPKDILSVRQAIRTVIENKDIRNELVKKGYENVKRFSKENISKAYLALYNKLK